MIQTLSLSANSLPMTFSLLTVLSHTILVFNSNKFILISTQAFYNLFFIYEMVFLRFVWGHLLPITQIIKNKPRFLQGTWFLMLSLMCMRKSPQYLEILVLNWWNSVVIGKRSWDHQHTDRYITREGSQHLVTKSKPRKSSLIPPLPHTSPYHLHKTLLFQLFSMIKFF